MLRSNGEMRKVLACCGESDCKQCHVFTIEVKLGDIHQC